MGSIKRNAAGLASALMLLGAVVGPANAQSFDLTKTLSDRALHSEPHHLVLTVSMLGGAHVLVAFGTPVTVHVKSEVSSSRVQPGDEIPLQLAEDVVVNGYVVMAKGADGAAVVESVVPASADSAGQIGLTFKWVRAVDGSKIGVTGQHMAAGGPGSNTDAADVFSTLSDTTNAAGAYEAANYLGRARNLLKSFSSHAKQSEATVNTSRTISLEVRNRNGVTITSSQRASANNDNDVK